MHGLTERQQRAIAASRQLVTLYEGSVSSGKTVAAIWRWQSFIHATADLPGELVMTARTRDSLWRNVLAPMSDLFPGTLGNSRGAGMAQMGAPSVTILGQRVNVIGASDSQAEAVIRGMTVKGFFIDELTVIPRDYFEMALSRLRVTGRKGNLASKMFATTNPDVPMHWLKKDYIDRIKIDPELARTWSVHHFTLDDNTALSEEYKRAVKAQYSGLFYERFIKGLWVQGDGMVWDSFLPSQHVVAHEALPTMDMVLALGVDYGSVHPSAGILLGMADGVLYAMDEWAPERPPGGTLPPARQSQSLLRWMRDRPDPDWVYVDGAARGFRDQLLMDGLTTAPAHKSVKPGLGLVHSLLTMDRLRISDRCTHLLDEIPGYVWDTKAVARGDEVPVKEADDFCDALRYAVVSSRHVWQPSMPLARDTT